MKSSVSRVASVLVGLEKKSKDFLNSDFEIKEGMCSLSPTSMLRAYGVYFGLRGCDLEIYCFVGGYCLSRAITYLYNSPYLNDDLEALNYTFAECSLRYIASKIKYSVASVKRSLNNLEKLGFLSRCGLGSHHRNKYKLLRCFRFNSSGQALYKYVVANSEPLNNLKKEKEINKEKYNNSLIYPSSFGFMSFSAPNSEIVADNLINDYDNYLEKVYKIVKTPWLDLID